MGYQEQHITYKGQPVFIKLSMPSFDRTLKQYVENEACFMFVNKGEVAVRTPEDYFKVNRQQGMLAKCLNYFFEPVKDSQSCDEGIESVGIFLYPSIVKDLFEFDFTQLNHKVDYNVKQVEVDKLLDNYRESINLLLDNPSLADESLIKAKLKEFILLVSKSTAAPSELDFLSAIFKPNEVNFKKVIQKHLYTNLSIDELASLAQMSTSSFKRKFKEVFDESPKKYINTKKIEKAVDLLQSTNDRVSDIAYDVGYDSLATFNRNFMDFVGKSPSDLRLNQNEKPLS
ncbi:AraC family transcriptional regulator [Flammeovirga sp. OC4]|uniref:helix-turn-helix domain-containing protein n=1 Tax=Flammeovirga sp. OC4 TaxID=1382345 RepID=UPI0005C4A7C5|nr:helix-turn-helix domain-containing protein [Flammeovirga sp. OC4]